MLVGVYSTACASQEQRKGSELAPAKLAELKATYQRFADKEECEVEATVRDDEGEVIATITATPSRPV